MPDSEPNSEDVPLVEPVAELAEQAQPDEDSAPQEQESVPQEGALLGELRHGEW